MEKYQFITSAAAFGCSTFVAIILAIILICSCIFPAQTDVDICALTPFTALFCLSSRLLYSLTLKHYKEWQAALDREYNLQQD